MHVLIFDDEVGIGRLVTRIATKLGMDSVAVTDTRAFEEHLRNDPPSVVLLDLQLGSTDGVAQMRLLADMRYDGALVLMSGFDTRVLTTARSVGQSLGLKVESVLQKPLRVAEVVQVLGHLRSAAQAFSTERLLAAIANDELVLDFQPIVSYKTKKLKKLEALVRWEHPTAGRISPDKFVPLAESDAVVIDALTDWVVGAAVRAHQELARLGVSVPIAVNISTRNLHDLTFPDRIEQQLRAGGVPPGHLCLEITESTAFRDPARTMGILSRIRLKGMNLSIDDFGTGFSSLKMLRQMPFCEIKIDRSFVTDATTSRDAWAIVKSIVDLAANMEMGCVAEGVETKESAELLERVGACNIQGYFIARPMPVAAIPAWQGNWTQCGFMTPSKLAGLAAQLPATRCGDNEAFKPLLTPSNGKRRSAIVAPVA
jgi:EAL domain-containing protein (putative c-di-GMP-specific phosphodiesterase class I)/CheY-like chemotaxis protein